ncbi:MAG: methyl-accepting chemotaxis protein [Desulfovibrionaceae bacterium]|nr:methyl-accepting chemotaxis protein [Desulfovibrionaceae bacterium]
MSIFKKVLLLVSLTIGVLIISLCTMGNIFISKMGDESTRSQLLVYSDVMQKEIDSALQAQETFGNLLQDDLDFARSIAMNDKETMHNFVEDMMGAETIDFMTIFDTQGVVLIRGHDDKAGDHLSRERLVVKVPLVEGKIISGIEDDSAASLSLSCGVPIRHENKIVGGVIIGQYLSTEKFVDRFKQLMNVECTIFMDDLRVATTIINQGKRAVGTKLNNPDIYERVVGKGERIVSRNVILGEEHDTAYWPWKDMAGKQGGIFFVGKSRTHMKELQFSVTLYFVIAGLVVGALMLAFGTIVARAIVKPLRAATAFAESVSNGDLDGNLTVTTRDESGVLSRALNVMVETLKTKMREAESKTLEAGEQAQKALSAVQEADQAKANAESGQQALLQAAENVEQVVGRLTTAVENINEQVESSSKSVSFQHERVTGSAAAMEEMNATVIEVSQNVSSVAASSERASERAREGASIVKESITSIAHVQKDTEQLKEAMRHLGEQTERIGTVMTVINDIADQTNLLALNAAIEAARAGEAGRGFAVVADEVRKLAEKTMGATKEVADVIIGIQSGARESIAAVDRTGKNLESATSLVSKSGESLSGIVSEAVSIADQIRSIAAAAEEQAATSEEIARSLVEINSSASETAEAMQSSKQATNELADQTHQLQELVRQIRK